MASFSTTIAVLFVGAMLDVGAIGYSQPLSSAADKRGGEIDNVTLTSDRLVQNFRPYHYNLELTPDIYQPSPPFPFNGSVQIYITCKNASNVITINSQDVTIDNSSVRISLVPGQTGDPSEPTLTSWRLHPEMQFLHITTAESLISGVSYILEMSFNGTLRSDGGALYYDSYNSSEGKTKYLATTHLEAHGGRMIFPCFDEPDFKATFNTTIVRQSHTLSVSNSPLRHEIDRGDGWFADVYDTTPKMSLYLLALGVGDLQKIPAGVINGYKINVWTRPEIVSLLDFFVRTLPRMHEWMDNETGITYGEPKSDHLVVPNKFGGMENWGLVIYGDSLAVYDPLRSSAAGKREIALIQGHEVAHMWFGNLVTCKWWDDAWLNEGFAYYYQHRATQVLGWEGSEASMVGIQQFMEDDQKNSSSPIKQSIPSPLGAGLGFSLSAYYKGGALVHMLEGILTTPIFKAGLKRYLQKFKYDTATADDLWQTMTDQAAADGIKNPDGSPLDMKRRMNPWLKQMGFPLVSVSRNTDGTATLKRSHFLRPQNQSIGTPSPYNYTWDVPITIVTADSAAGAWDAAPSAWIDIGDTETTVSGFPTDPKKWAVVNAKFSMFYRVLYDDESLAAIVAQLVQDHTAIHVESRSQIIDDAFSVARSGHIISEIDAMETTRYLANETRWGPWNTAIRHLSYSDRLIRNLSWGGLQRTYVLGLTVPVYEKLGRSYNDTETPFQQFLRRDMFALSCAYRHADFLTEARNEYALIAGDPAANVVNPNNLPTVLCVGVREGTEVDWQLTFDQYLARKSSQISEERYAYLFGCTCTNDTALLERLVVELGTSVSPRDQNQLAIYLSMSENGADYLWNYLDINWGNLIYVNRMALLRNIGLGFTTQTELDNLLAFKARHPPMGPEAASYTDLILDIRNNIDWLSHHGPSLDQWLKNHQPAEGSSPMTKRSL